MKDWEGWAKAIDEALVMSFIGVANADDSYDEAKRKLNLLLCQAEDIGAYFEREKMKDV